MTTPPRKDQEPMVPTLAEVAAANVRLLELTNGPAGPFRGTAKAGTWQDRLRHLVGNQDGDADTLIERIISAERAEVVRRVLEIIDADLERTKTAVWAYEDAIAARIFGLAVRQRIQREIGGG